MASGSVISICALLPTVLSTREECTRLASSRPLTRHATDTNQLRPLPPLPYSYCLRFRVKLKKGSGALVISFANSQGAQHRQQLQKEEEQKEEEPPRTTPASTPPEAPDAKLFASVENGDVFLVLAAPIHCTRCLSSL